MKAVIDLGFGDSGKGILTDYLCSEAQSPVVVRFSGGSQAGHTVVRDGVRHVFSNFGSGTLSGIPTYWSRFCTVDPEALITEFHVLKAKGADPYMTIHPDCPITTPFDRHFNQHSALTKEHGTCGVGFGATIEREENFYSLRFKDLFNTSVLKIKMNLIQKYYGFEDLDLGEFYKAVDTLEDLMPMWITMNAEMPDGEKVFEGSQGLLLDKDIGFFPHVTRSNTGTKNILKMIEDADRILEGRDIYMVTRAYQTRHGNGPMTNEHIDHDIKDNPNETNQMHEYQGEFRKTVLDLDLLRYAIESDDCLRTNVFSKLVITCLDHVEGEWRFTENGELKEFGSEDEFVEAIQTKLGAYKVIRFRSEETPSLIYK